MPRLSAEPENLTLIGSLAGGVLTVAAIALTVTHISDLAFLAVPGALLLSVSAARHTIQHREAQLRRSVDLAIAELEALLVARAGRSRADVGGVAELCPLCGRPVDPRTARCECRRPRRPRGPRRPRNRPIR